jgi:YcaO-like protein with predicted kinase domain
MIPGYILQPSIKRFAGYKARAPQETINQLKTRFAELGLELRFKGGPVLLPKYNHSLHCYLRSDGLVLAQANGKGRTPELALASALAELAERLSALRIDPKRDSGNRNVRYDYIFYDNHRAKMKQLWEDRNQELRQEPLTFYPTFTDEGKCPGYCYSFQHGQMFAYPEQDFFSQKSCNGLASGNTLEEALAHGIYESVERLCGWYIFYHQPDMEQIDLHSIEDNYIQGTVEGMEELGIRFSLHDLSALFGIPTVVGFFRFPYSGLDFKMSIGVEASPLDAISRSLTEVLQGVPPLWVSDRFQEKEIQQDHKFRKILKYWSLNNLLPPGFYELGESYLSTKATTSIKDIPETVYDLDQSREIEKVVAQLKERNFDLCFRNLTTNYLNFPCVLTFLVNTGNKLFDNIPVERDFLWMVPEHGREKEYLESLSAVEKEIKVYCDLDCDAYKPVCDNCLIQHFSRLGLGPFDWKY